VPRLVFYRQLPQRLVLPSWEGLRRTLWLTGKSSSGSSKNCKTGFTTLMEDAADGAPSSRGRASDSLVSICGRV
jgi:hypothetical protein